MQPRCHLTLWLALVADIAAPVPAAAAAAAETSRRADGSRSVRRLEEMTSSSRPAGVTSDFDCGWRRLAFEYATTQLLEAVPSAEQQRALHDALELSVLCEGAFEEPDHARVQQAAGGTASAAGAGAGTAPHLFVATDGVDSDTAGSTDAPFRTLHAALAAARRRHPIDGSSGSPRPTIVLREGTHYLQTPVRLTGEDSGLTIAAHAGESVVMSGGTLLQDLHWTPVLSSNRGSGSSGVVVHVAQLTDAQLQSLEEGPGQAAKVPALRINGSRVTLARYPNANVEIDLFPVGYITAETAWRPPVFPPYNTASSKPCVSAQQVLLSEMKLLFCDAMPLIPQPENLPRQDRDKIQGRLYKKGRFLAQCGVSFNVTIPAGAHASDDWKGIFANWTEGVGGAENAFLGAICI